MPDPGLFTGPAFLFWHCDRCAAPGLALVRSDMDVTAKDACILLPERKHIGHARMRTDVRFKCAVAQESLDILLNERVLRNCIGR